MSFHLRPVPPVDARSVSPSSSSSTVSDRTPPPHTHTRLVHPIPATTLKPVSRHPSPQIVPSQSASGARPRRPLSPSTLRDVDLSNRGNMPPRKYPAPPTGHELMALFPPAPPLNVRSGPTSGYFQREERAFFAQAGKEIVRVQFEVDLPGDGTETARDRPSAIVHSPSSSDARPGSRPPQQHWHDAQHVSPTTRNLPPVPFSRTSSSRTGMITPIDVQPSLSRPSQPPPPTADAPPFAPPRYDVHPDHAHLSGPGNPHMHAPPPPQDGMDQDAYGAESDDAWRRPMPHNQRRRAGKHTKRVVVK